MDDSGIIFSIIRNIFPDFSSDKKCFFMGIAFIFIVGTVEEIIGGSGCLTSTRPIGVKMLMYSMKSISIILKYLMTRILKD